ncbi:hypothetical protein F4775DRAFT_593914 [Biscogniauxia sp. FL1348]|nr:hypothetical protein F4775DRAFT_593914 [Biscogniauxia sp. FL1348]
MPFLSTPLTLSATGSIVGSAWISGGINALSICAIPAILQSGAPTEGLVRAWHTQFTRALYLPAAAVIAATNYLYLAGRHRGARREWRGYAAAAAANLLLVPFTQLFIMGINNRLMASMPGAGEVEVALGYDEAAQLIARWGRLNLVRTFLPLTGAALGLWNLLQ